MRVQSNAARNWIITLTAACALVGWVVLLLYPAPPVGAPYGSITLLGYTNNSAGSRVAMFCVTNPSNIVVARAPYCIIEFKPPGHDWTPQYLVTLSNPARRSILRPKTCEVIQIPPPDSQAPWRASVRFFNDVGSAWPVKRLVNAACHWLGRPEPYGFTERQIDSAGIEGRIPTN